MTVTTGSFVAKDGAGNDVELPKYAPGRAAAAAAAPVALSTEDLAALTDIAAGLATITGHVDGLEGLATSLNGYVDGLETLQGTTNTTLTALAGYVDGLEALETALSAKLPSTLGTKTGANSLSVVPASDAAFNIDASLRASGTSTKASVASLTTSTPLLASNANRKGAIIWNDSTAVLYVDLTGGTASGSSCSVALIAGEYYEVPFGLSGAITGIWASANGFARVTEIL